MLATLVMLCLAGSLFAAEPERAAPAVQPRVEVAFVLDTTGSMGGLIAGAKEKIWYIANQIVLGKPTPIVRMALVPYRDKGDEYVTKVFDLTDNIDQVYTDLMKFQAGGGGDSPENVNQALHDAVHKPIPRRNGLHHAESGWQPRIQAVAQPSGLCSGSHLPIRPDRSVPDGTYG